MSQRVGKGVILEGKPQENVGESMRMVSIAGSQGRPGGDG